MKMGVVCGSSWPALGMGSDIMHPGVKVGVVDKNVESDVTHPEVKVGVV